MRSRIRSLLRALFFRRDFEDGLSEELRFHLEELTRDLIRSGMAPAEASRRARMELGSLPDVEENCREARGLHLFDGLARDLRHAYRLLRKAPAFSAAALGTLALCLGANLTIFAVVDAILLRPLPFPEPDRLVTIFNTYPKAGVERDGSSITNYFERRGRIPAFGQIALYNDGSTTVGEPGATERLPVTRVTPEFFSTLGSAPRLGRTFTEAETTYQTDNVVILTDDYWRQRMNADPDVVGRTIRVDGAAMTVLGVLPPSFRFLSSKARLYRPLSSRPEDRTPANRHSGGNAKHMIARLEPGATLAQAQAQIDAQNAALEADSPTAQMMADAGFRSIVTSLRGDHVAAIRPALVLIQLGALALLLIGAVNLANLLLIRASARVKELSVRRALGAGRRHVIGEVVVETTLITLAGGLLGLGVGACGIRLVAALGADQLPLGSTIAYDTRLALAALFAAVVTALVLAVPIAWFHLRGQVAGALQSESRGGTAGHAAHRLRHSFIVGQLAMALILLTGAGLLGRNLERAMAVSPGFRPDHVLTGQLTLAGSAYSRGASRLEFTERLTNALREQPGVLAAGVAVNVPFSGVSGKSSAKVKGSVLAPGESPRGRYSYGVDGSYFEALGFTLQEGRFLTAADSRRSERFCVVDESFAREYWPRGGALGQQLFQGPDEGPEAEAFTIVGVVGGVKQAGLTESAGQGAVYYPYAFRSNNSLFVTVRTSRSPESLSLALQDAVRHIDPDLPVTDIRSMESRIADSLTAQRTPALVAGVFSLIAVLLTGIGTDGVLSYAVAQRRREIAVRVALGARPGQIRGQFLSLGSKLLAAGVLLGAAGAWATTRTMQSMLFEASGSTVTTLAWAAVIVSAAGLAACLLPCRRAARVPPMEALGDS